MFKNKGIHFCLSVLLLTSILGQTVCAISGGGQSLGEPTDPPSQNYNTPGIGHPSGHFGWLVSLQEVDNTVKKYEDDTRLYDSKGKQKYTDSAVSIADKYLYDYPTEYIYDYYEHPEKYAYIDRVTKEDAKTYEDGHLLQTVSPAGAVSGGRLANVYGVYYHRNEKGNFKENAKLIEKSAKYAELKELFLKRQLNMDLIKGCVADSDINKAIGSFVGGFVDPRKAIDALNDFTLGTGEALDDNDRLVRYLDIFIMFNRMCNSEYDEYINNFCKSLNDNGSAKFLTILMATGLQAQGAVLTSDSKYRPIITMPNWYALRRSNDGTVEDLRHPGTDGGGDIFSNASTEMTYGRIHQFYNENAPCRNDRTMYMSINSNTFWWDEKKIAQSLYPKSVSDVNSGNVGYTYISTNVLPTIPPPPPPGDDPKPDPTPQPKPQDPKLEFYIEVESDSYMLNQAVAPAMGLLSPRQTARRSLTARQPIMRSCGSRTIRNPTRCIDGEMRPKTLQMIWGHASIDIMMNLYVHVTEDSKKQEIIDVERALKVI